MVLFDIAEATWKTRICNIDSLSLMQVFAVSFLSILFLQSGLDKVFDWKVNLAWLKSHFANSILGKVVPILLGIITFFEVAAGVFSTIGVVNIIVGNGDFVAFIGAALSALALLMLFFGQRIAKDYAGAGGLVPCLLYTSPSPRD